MTNLCRWPPTLVVVVCALGCLFGDHASAGTGDEGKNPPIAGHTAAVCRESGPGLKGLVRKTPKLPKFKAAHQLYGLLVLGDKAELCVWLIVDGDTLYIDRDGDGDLRDPNERINGKLQKPSGGKYATRRDWTIGKLAAAGRYTDVQLCLRTPNLKWRPRPDMDDFELQKAHAEYFHAGDHPNSCGIWLKIAGKRTQFGTIRLSADPSKAPVAHMDGPLTIGIVSPLMNYEIGIAKELTVALGTPGLGRAGFSYVLYEEVAPDARPYAIITFPGLKPRRYELKGKC